MGCVCAKKLLTALQNLKSLPLAALAEAIPDNLPFAAMNALSSNLMGYGPSATAQIKAVAPTAMSARLSANLRLPSVANLEAMAQIALVMRVNPLAPPASSRMALMIRSLNSNLPPIIASLLDLLAPLAAKLAALSSMLSTANVVNQTMGLNMLTPSTLPKLVPALQARLDVTAAPPPLPEASLAAIANLAAHTRLATASQALGINLLAPNGIPRLANALNMAAQITLPPLTVPLASMGALAAALAPIQAAQNFFNMKLVAPNAAQLLKVAIARLLSAMEELNGLNLNVRSITPSSPMAPASAAAILNASPLTLPVAGFNFLGMVLPPIPDLSGLSMAANINEFLGGEPAQSHPCSGCPVGGMF